LSLAVVIQLVARAVPIAIGVCVVYAISKMRKTYAAQESNFSKAIRAVEEIQKLLPQLLLLTQNVQSDGQALQKVALQIESSVAELKNSVGSAVQNLTEQHANTIDDLRNHLDFQEERLVMAIKDISERMQVTPPPQIAGAESIPSPPTPVADGSVFITQQVRFRKEVIEETISQEPEARFAALKDWISTNSLAIVYRASHGSAKTTDLIATVPSYLEPQAEIGPGGVLLVSTRGYPEKIAIRLNETART
jgi:hypothetical protein